MFDVVVIGAGPAGAMTAFHAARGGLRILLVDRAPLGRPKACGDALTPNAVAAVHRMDCGRPDWHPVAGLLIHNTHSAHGAHNERGGCGTELFEHHGAPHFGTTIERRLFDEWMTRAAIAAGAEFQLGEVGGLRYDTDGARVCAVELRTASGVRQVAADRVVFATGAAVPSFAKHLFTRATPLRFAAAVRGYVDADVDSEKNDFLHALFPIVADSAALLGYAWAFPMGGRRVNVGVGVLRDLRQRAVSLPALIEAAVAPLAEHAGLHIDTATLEDVRSAPLMMGPAVGAPRGVLAVGDAAGLIHPASGEGIAAALESGELAAQALLSGDNAGADYWSQLRAKKRRLYEGARRIQVVVERPAFAVQRGADVMTRNDRFAGRAMRRFIWDVPEGPTSAARRADPFLDGVYRVVVEGIAATVPGAAVLMEELIDSGESDFGWLARFHAAARADLGLAVEERHVVQAALLEATALQQYLYDDLVGRSDDAREHGNNALAVLAADALTAFVMAAVADAEEPVARLVLAESRAVLEAQAVANAGDRAAGRTPLPWRLAAKLVALELPDRTLHAPLFDAAQAFDAVAPAVAMSAGSDSITQPDEFVGLGRGLAVQALHRDYVGRPACGS